MKTSNLQLFKCCYNVLQQEDKENICKCSKRVLNTSLPFQNALRKVLAMPPICQKCSQCALYSCSQCSLNLCKSCSKSCYQHKHSLKQPNQNLSRFQQCKLHSLSKDICCSCNYTNYCKKCILKHRQKCKHKVKSTEQVTKQISKGINNSLLSLNQQRQTNLKLQNLMIQLKNRQKNGLLDQIKQLNQSFNYLHQLLQFKKAEIQQKLQEEHLKVIRKVDQVVHAISKNNQQISLFSKTFKSTLNDSCFEIMIHLLKWGTKIQEKKITANQQQLLSSKIKVNVSYNKIQEAIKNLLNNSCRSQRNSRYSARQTSARRLQTPNKKISNILKSEQSRIINTPTAFVSQGARPLQAIPSHHQIYVKWCHFPHQKSTYQLQYGIGLKIKGNQIFKKIQANYGKAIIQGLSRQTNYRLRLRKIEGLQIENWSKIIQVRTLPQPRFQINQSYHFANYKRSLHQIQFTGSGTLYCNNPLYFGKHQWSIQIVIDKFSTSDQTGRVFVGVTNKNNKKPNFIGSSINYGLQKETFTIRIKMDIKQNLLIISHPKNQSGQKYTVFPSLPLYQFIQNKSTSKSVNILSNFK